MTNTPYRQASPVAPEAGIPSPYRESPWRRLAFVGLIALGPASVVLAGMPVGALSSRPLPFITYVVWVVSSYVIGGLMIADSDFGPKAWQAWSWRRKALAFAFMPLFMPLRGILRIIKWIINGDKEA